MQELQTLQQKGVGTHLSYAQTGEQQQAEHLQQDHFDLQQQLQNTAQSPIMQQSDRQQDNSGTLEIARQASNAAASTDDELEAREDALDEIFIDLRGQLHHKKTDEE